VVLPNVSVGVGHLPYEEIYLPPGHTWKRRSQIKNLNLIGAIRCCHVMYKLLYASIRVRTAPPVSVRVRVRVSVSFRYGVTLLRILFLNLGPPFSGLPIVVPNATTLPMHSTPGIDSSVIRIQTAGTEYISPVLGIPPQSIFGGDHTQTQPNTLHYSAFSSVIRSTNNCRTHATTVPRPVQSYIPHFWTSDHSDQCTSE